MKFTSIVLGTLLLSTGISSAQPDSVDSSDTQADSSETVFMDDVVISASRWTERASTVSREISSISPLDIIRKNPATTADALAQIGTISIQKSQLGGGSPMLRGYAANAVLTVVDGVRVNNAIYRSGNLQNVISIDGFSLDRAEILYGPGSVQYGSDALGGVMVFSTRNPILSDSGFSYGGASLVRYGTAMNEVTGSVAVDLAGQSVASSTVVTVSSFSDLDGGASFMGAYPSFGARPWFVERIDGTDSIVTNPDSIKQTPTGYQQYNIIENILWKASDSINIEYRGLFTTSSDIPRYDRLVELRNGKPRASEWYYGPQLWTLHSLTLRSSDASVFGDDVVLAGAFQYYQESRNDRSFDSTSLRNQTERVLIGSFTADVRVRLAESERSEADLYYGIEAYINDVESKAHRTDIESGEETPTATRYPNGGSTVASGAAYAQVRWDASNVLSTAAGVRFTYYDLRSRIADTSFMPLPFSDLSLTTSALTGSVGATWQTTRVLSIHGNVSSGFRAPNIDDIAKVFESAGGILIVPNADLKPEYAYTLEGGADLHIADVSVTLNAYRTWAVNAIESRPSEFNGQDTIEFNGVPRAIYKNVNIGRADIVGLNLVTQTRLFEWLTARGTVSWNDGTDIVNNIPLRHIPPVFGSFSLEWREPLWNIGASFWWAAAKLFADLPPEEQAKVGINYTRDGTPAWRRLDAAAGIRVWNPFELTLIIENIFDLNYHTFASAISSPGRNAVLVARYSW